MNYFSFLSSLRTSSLTRSATEVYSGCDFRYSSICSYSGSGRETCLYPFAIYHVWYRFLSNIMTYVYTIYSRKFNMRFNISTKYGRGVEKIERI